MTTSKIKLIEEVLRIIYPTSTIENIIFEDDQRVSFTMPVTRSVGWRYEVEWDNDLNFRVYYFNKGDKNEHHPRTSTWFRVGRLLDKHHLASEKLKFKYA